MCLKNMSLKTRYSETWGPGEKVTGFYSDRKYLFHKPLPQTGVNRDRSGFSTIRKRILPIWGLLFLITGIVQAQEEFNVIRGTSSNNSWPHFSDIQNALYQHVTGEVYELLDERAAEISRLQTLADWQQRQQNIRDMLHNLVGPFPKKTYLNARILRTVHMESYQIDHIVYESQPGYHVTSSLYLPNNRDGRTPVILYLSGHAQEGYRSETYQHVIVNLVKKGFIVFAIDPLGQGEREEYFDSNTGRSVVGSATREHSYAGAQAFITGSSLARYMVWDIIRGVDYLVTRPEVDPNRIGATGRSGGGTQTAYAAALDERIYAAAPEAFISTLSRQLQANGTPDAEQFPYHGAKHGFDHADFLVVRAPKPTLMLTTTEDFISIQGARETADEVSRIYQAYDKEENFAMTEDFGRHESTRKNREAMYAFFQKYLDNPGNPVDEAVTIPGDEQLRVTQTGQVATSYGGETVYSLNHKEAKRRMQKMRSARRHPDRHLPKVLYAAKELSGYRDPGDVPQAAFTGRIPREGYVIEKYFIQGEGDYVIPYLLMVPEHSNQKSLIYVHPSGKAAEASQGGEAEWFVRKGFTVLLPDMVGIGELGPGELRRYETTVKNFESTWFDVWPTSVFMARSITGIRAADVVRLTRWLQVTMDTETIYGMARDDMAPVMLHAAAFEPSIEALALINPYASYHSIVMERFYDPGFHISTVAGSIGVYDLPDLAATLAPRKLLMAGITDGAGSITQSESIRNDLSVIQAAYEYANASGKLTITNRAFSPAILFENEAELEAASGNDATDNLYRLISNWLE